MAPIIREYAPVEEAIGQVRARIRRERSHEYIPTLESYGRILAADVHAPEDVPPNPTSHMDGFAVRSGDLEAASPSRPARLKVVGTSGPGERSRHRLKAGEAIQVATGSILPEGADTVVPVESANVAARSLRIGFAQGPGRHVYGAGQDIRKGELVLPEGHAIRAQDVGILLSLGLLMVRVRRRPVLAIMATGSELTPARAPRKGKTLESHSPIFLRLAQALGCATVDFGVVGDDSRKLGSALRKALARSDFVLTLGGTSAGKRDLVTASVAGLQPEALVHGLRLDRGRVTGLASVKGKPILMLPGPIQAAANAFLVVGVPIIEALSGSDGTGLVVPCVLGGRWEARSRFSDFRKVVYVKLRPGGQATADPISGETESMKLLADADGFFVVPENVTSLEAGARVDVRLVPGFSLA